jgi:hypothetical protein
MLEIRYANVSNKITICSNWNRSHYMCDSILFMKRIWCKVLLYQRVEKNTSDDYQALATG